MMTLAPHAPKVNGQQSLQFYVPDGKYKMQVFALEDLRDGNMTVYCGDVLDDAVKAGVLAPRKHASEGTPNVYHIKGAEQEWLTVEQLDGKSPNPAPFYKDMLGWNRKASAHHAAGQRQRRAARRHRIDLRHVSAKVARAANVAVQKWHAPRVAKGCAVGSTFASIAWFCRTPNNPATFLRRQELPLACWKSAGSGSPWRRR